MPYITHKEFCQVHGIKRTIQQLPQFGQHLLPLSLHYHAALPARRAASSSERRIESGKEAAPRGAGSARLVRRHGLIVVPEVEECISAWGASVGQSSPVSARVGFVLSAEEGVGQRDRRRTAAETFDGGLTAVFEVQVAHQGSGGVLRSCGPAAAGPAVAGGSGRRAPGGAPRVAGSAGDHAAAAAGSCRLVYRSGQLVPVGLRLGLGLGPVLPGRSAADGHVGLGSLHGRRRPSPPRRLGQVPLAPQLARRRRGTSCSSCAGEPPVLYRRRHLPLVAQVHVGRLGHQAALRLRLRLPLPLRRLLLLQLLPRCGVMTLRPGPLPPPVIVVVLRTSAAAAQGGPQCIQHDCQLSRSQRRLYAGAGPIAGTYAPKAESNESEKQHKMRAAFCQAFVKAQKIRKIRRISHPPLQDLCECFASPATCILYLMRVVGWRM